MIQMSVQRTLSAREWPLRVADHLCWPGRSARGTMAESSWIIHCDSESSRSTLTTLLASLWRLRRNRPWYWYCLALSLGILMLLAGLNDRSITADFLTNTRSLAKKEAWSVSRHARLQQRQPYLWRR